MAASGDPVARWLVGSPGDDVYATYERIRARGPVVDSKAGVLAVTSHELCQTVLRDSRFGVRPADGSPVRNDPALPDVPGSLTGSFLELDPPDHTRLRRVAAPAFRPAVVRTWTPRIEAVLHHLMDEAEHRARHGADVDLMVEVAAPFPIAVVSEMLGIPDVDAARFARIGALAGQSLDGVRSPRQARALRAVGDELDTLFTRLLDERSREPRDDVISALASARDRDEATAADVVGIAGLLLIAGFETTVNLIGNGIAALHASPQTWYDLVHAPATAQAVVEETLRWDPSVQGTARVAHEQLELAGRSVPAGSTVLVLTAAANRDPLVYRDPFIFDPGRTGEVEHLTFSTGIHYCLGAPLARLEGEVAFRLLAERWSQLRLVPTTRRRPGATIRGYSHLPARL
ncbi:cytochrome P450 [Jannaschia sp. R86511]|uniref:cytochrome P450 n=1 Tax=Jannaschia sp. R86511 TaxID=3093853 RepID=UPI0036D30999